jgi:hypothetical protein
VLQSPWALILAGTALRRDAVMVSLRLPFPFHLPPSSRRSFDSYPRPYARACFLDEMARSARARAPSPHAHLRQNPPPPQSMLLSPILAQLRRPGVACQPRMRLAPWCGASAPVCSPAGTANGPRPARCALPTTLRAEARPPRRFPRPCPPRSRRTRPTEASSSPSSLSSRWPRHH